MDIKDIIHNYIQRPDPVIFDIGANNGSDTVDFAKRYPKGSIRAFEPDPRAYKKLAENTANNFNVFRYDFVISDTTGVITFNQSSGKNPFFKNDSEWDFSGSIKKPKDHLKIHPWCKFEKEIIVKTYKLDRFCKILDIDFIDLIWMDVQGAELNVFKGAKRLLENNKIRLIYTEYSETELYEGAPSRKDIENFLPNFKTIGIFDNNILLFNKDATHDPNYSAYLQGFC